MMTHHPAIVVSNGVATGIILAAWSGYLPAIAAGFAILWYIIEIIETVTRWVKALKARPAQADRTPSDHPPE